MVARKVVIPPAIAALTAAVVLPLVLVGGIARSWSVPAFAVHATTGPVTVNARGTTFRPEPGHASRAKLSAAQAYADYNHGGSIPSRVSYGYGALTVPLGPGTPGRDLLHNQPVWAFSTITGCPVISTGIGTTSPPQSPGQRCTAWTFLDPSDGSQILSTYSSPQ
jgi:hypothetical protein